MSARRLLLAVAAAIPLAVVVLTEATAATSTVNDWSTQLGSLPAAVDGSTKGARVRKGAPEPSCSAGQGVVWYTTTAPVTGPMLATVTAGGDAGAGLVVYRLVRSKTTELICKVTGDDGTASAPWYSHEKGTYLIGVTRRTDVPAGSYRLTVASREPLPRPPGSPLPSGGVSETVSPYVDAVDAWAMPMRRGVSYKVNVASLRECVRLDIYRPGSYLFVDDNHAEHGTLTCGGYLLFTPGVDGGGTYSLVLRAKGTKALPQPYRLRVAEASADDTAPGIALTNGEPVTGALDSAALDVIDLYSFNVPHDGSLTTIDFKPSPGLKYDLLVLDETGGKVAGVTGVGGARSIEDEIHSGRYFVALRAVHQTAGAYKLTVLTRQVTATTLSVNGARYIESAEGSSVSLQVFVTAVSHGGAVEIEIDRFDPIFGWQFATLLPGQVSSSGSLSVSWRPPWVGHWRAIARFPGNIYSTPSKSDYVRIHVVAPLD